MKRPWLLYLLLFSLALNVGTVGALLYFRYQAPPGPPSPAPTGHGFLRLLHSLDLDKEQQDFLRQTYPPHRQQIQQLRQEIANQRQRLFDMLRQPQPPEADIAAQITVINNLQNALEQELAQYLLKVKQNLRPDQQDILLEHVRRRLCDPRFCRPTGEHPRGRGPGGPPHQVNSR